MGAENIKQVFYIVIRAGKVAALVSGNQLDAVHLALGLGAGVLDALNYVVYAGERRPAQVCLLYTSCVRH